ncbi:hypothetical protein [Flexibacterium corallicola]|uniref:hypothetical protein n=1 Tax=Flexibacterium corallicola TaxID=3037259 RepID=UPI00286F7185|nr:hypothetical protein [Pseudovibrio sp. M1P-2-3]
MDFSDTFTIQCTRIFPLEMMRLREKTIKKTDVVEKHADYGQVVVDLHRLHP